ncbi:MAG: ABC transporter permease subunit [Jiangellales bacterium]|jgi:ABC-2 type transport system permease protein
MSDLTASGLQPLHGHGWRAGLSPLMRAGFGAWWRTREWWTQALLWTVVINGSVAVAVWGDAPEDLGVFGLYGVMTMFAAIAVAILMQEEIVGEKRSGTAAWVLSKPASRDAFLLSKLVPNAVGVVATMIAIPSAVLLVQTLLAGVEVSVPRFALGALVPALNLLFYLTLTLMLGTLFDSAGPVIAIPLAFAFGQQLVAGIPGLGMVLPWALVVGTADSDTSVTGAIITGQPIPAPLALVTTALACAVFVTVALYKWRRTEL